MNLRSSFNIKYFSLFFMVLGFCLLLSGRYEIYYLLAAMISALFACYFHHQFLKDKNYGDSKNSNSKKLKHLKILNLLPYIILLIKDIIKSSIIVSFKMWHIKPTIRARAFWVKTNLSSDLLETIYANSVTLTPGSVTIFTKKNSVYIHCLDSKFSNDIKSLNLLKKVQMLEGR